MISITVNNLGGTTIEKKYRNTKETLFLTQDEMDYVARVLWKLNAKNAEHANVESDIKEDIINQGE